MALNLGKVRTASTHSLHEARTAAAFRSLFTEHCGREVEDVLAEVVDPSRVLALVLGGSIPLGIGTGGSDIDFLVVIDSEEALEDRLGAQDILFAFDDVGGRTQPSLAKYGLLIEGLKVDFMLIDVARLDALIDRTAGSRTNLTAMEIAILSRLKVGWDLSPVAQSYAERLGQFRAGRALEIQCVVKHLMVALHDLGHARLAAGENARLSVYLARQAIDLCFQARFAAAGFASVGGKWIRFITAHPDALSNQPDIADRVGEDGLNLLFCPLPGDLDQLESFLDRVAQFFVLVRGEIERDLEMKIAISLCRQIYNPV